MPPVVIVVELRLPTPYLSTLTILLILLGHLACLDSYRLDHVLNRFEIRLLSDQLVAIVLVLDSARNYWIRSCRA